MGATSGVTKNHTAAATMVAAKAAAKYSAA
jgi:hypothetical protein